MYELHFLYLFQDEENDECGADVLEDDQLIGAIDNEVSSSLIGLDNSEPDLIGGPATEDLIGGEQSNSSLLIGGLDHNSRIADGEGEHSSSLLIGGVASFPIGDNATTNLIGQNDPNGQFFSIPLSADNQGT